MNVSASHVTKRAAELRLAFDRAFAEPARRDTTPREDLLAVRVGTLTCAMRLSEISGLFADKNSAWESAERAGETLAEHVVNTITSDREVPSTITPSVR